MAIRRSGRTLAIGLAIAIGSAGCAPAMRQSAVMQRQGAAGMSAAELQYHLHDFTLRYGGVIEETAFHILAERPEPLVRLAVLRWRLHAVQAFQKPLFQPDPFVALVDAWLLAEQMIQYYQEGAGRGALGSFEVPVVDTCTTLRDELRVLFERSVGGTASRDINRAQADDWVRAHPIRSDFFVRQSVATESARTLAAASGATLGSALASAESTLQTLDARMTFLVEMMPKQVAWQAELMAAEMLIDPATGTMTLENLMPVNEYLDRVQALADAQMKTAFAEIDRMRAETLADVGRERVAVLEGVDGEREAVFADIARERRAVLAAVDDERAQILVSVHKEIEAATARLTEERKAALAQVDATAERSVRDAGAMSAALLDRLFWRLLVLVAVTFALALVSRVVASRLADHRSGSA